MSRQSSHTTTTTHPPPPTLTLFCCFSASNSPPPNSPLPLLLDLVIIVISTGFSLQCTLKHIEEDVVTAIIKRSLQSYSVRFGVSLPQNVRETWVDICNDDSGNKCCADTGMSGHEYWIIRTQGRRYERSYDQ